MAKLTLETFNGLLFGALKDQSPQGKIDLIDKELELIANLVYEKTGELLDELQETGYHSKLFDEIASMKNNAEWLFAERDRLEAEIKAQEGGSDDQK